MKREEEFEIAEECKEAPQKIVEFFSSERPAPDPADVDLLAEDFGNLEPTEIDEAFCAELHMLEKRQKAIEARIKKLKDFAKAKRDRGALQLGGYVLTLKERKGQNRIDWKEYVRDAIGSETVPAKYVKEGDPVVVVSVEKLKT